MSGLASIINSTINNTTNNTNQFSSTITYREGESNPNNINVFSTLLGAVNKAQSIGPNTYVFIDPSLGSPTTELNATYNLHNLRLTGGDDGGAAISVLDGSKFTGTSMHFYGLSINSSSNSSIVDISSSLTIITLDFGSSFSSTNSSFIMTDSSSGFLSLILKYQSFIANLGAVTITANSANGVGIFTDFATAIGINTLAGNGSIAIQDLTNGIANPTLSGPGLASISQTQPGTSITYQ